MPYDVRIDQHGDTWIVVEVLGRRYEYNKTRIEEYERQATVPPVVFDEPWTYKKMREQSGKEQER